MTVVLFTSALAVGFGAGIASGLIGIGGGVLLVPGLAMFCGLGQRVAQGTSLATLLAPASVFGIAKYWHAGNINLGVAAIAALGFLPGCLIGAKLSGMLPESILRIVFGSLLLYLGVTMLAKGIADTHFWRS